MEKEFQNLPSPQGSINASDYETQIKRVKPEQDENLEESDDAAGFKFPKNPKNLDKDSFNLGATSDRKSMRSDPRAYSFRSGVKGGRR